MKIIAGDQLTLGVDFTIDGQPADFAENTAELVVNIGQQERTFQPTEYQNNTAKFYLSGEDTAGLLAQKHDGRLTFSVRFFFGGDENQRETPIFRQPLTIER